MKIVDINIDINISPRIHVSCTRADKDSKRDNVSRMTKMIFWRVLLPIIISLRDIIVLWGKYFTHTKHIKLC